MKKSLVSIAFLTASHLTFGQQMDIRSTIKNSVQQTLASDDWASSNKESVPVRAQSFNYDCSTNFWTVSGGLIQQWTLSNHAITGSTIIVNNASNFGIAFCGDSSYQTFYTPYAPFGYGIQYYDSTGNWVLIPTPSYDLSNNGGHLNYQYFMRTVNFQNKMLYFFDGSNLTVVDSLTSDFYSVADIAVDKNGRAWVFKGPAATTTTSLSVYDNNGLLNTYSISFNSTGASGSMIINDTLYIGILDSAIIPITISGTNAIAGTPIPFPYYFADLASCQTITPASVSELIAESEHFNIFPNPTNGKINFQNVNGIIRVEIFDLSGRCILSTETPEEISLANYPVGMYLFKIISMSGSFIEKVIKH